MRRIPCIPLHRSSLTAERTALRALPLLQPFSYRVLHASSQSSGDGALYSFCTDHKTSSTPEFPPSYCRSRSTPATLLLLPKISPTTPAHLLSLSFEALFTPSQWRPVLPHQLPILSSFGGAAMALANEPSISKYCHGDCDRRRHLLCVQPRAGSCLWQAPV